MRVRHLKRGTEYTVIGTGRAQGNLTDDDPAVVYRGDDGSLWVRHQAEFSDGRFEEIGSAPETIDDLRRRRDELLATTNRYLERARAAEAEAARMRGALTRQSDEICQTLGKALGYPWFKDDQANFPGATEADGVCVGEHVAESLAAEAADRIRQMIEALEPFAKLADTFDRTVMIEVCEPDPDNPSPRIQPQGGEG